MADRPIIFSAPMIRALIEGRKTQTRRVLKPKAVASLACAHHIEHVAGHPLAREYDRSWPIVTGYAPGDRLWVREAHALVGSVDPGWLLYRASGYEAECERHGFDRPYPPEVIVRWRPSIHMPRWASRLTLTVTDVRVQRLQDISEDDARAEGVEAVTLADVPRPAAWTLRQDFSRLWNSIHGPDAWHTNPWVCAISFDVHQHNIDQMEPAHG